MRVSFGLAVAPARILVAEFLGDPMQIRHVRQAVVVLLGILLSSCAYLDGTKRLKDPVIVDSVELSGKTTVVQSVTSDRRIVLYREGVVCPEAPPDTASNISATVSAALTASGSALKDAGAPSVGGSFGSQLATALNHVTKPSQGILLMRYAIASDCIALANGVISPDEYHDLLIGTLQSAVAMTMYELKLTGGKIGDNVEAVDQSAPSLSGTFVSAPQAAKAAETAAKDATSGDGKAKSEAAAQKAGDDAKSKIKDSATPAEISAATGQAAYSAVFDVTKNKTKAESARTKAIGNIYAAAAQSAAATANASGGQQTSVSNAPIPSGAEDAYSRLSKGGSAGVAAAYERVTFDALQRKDVDSALSALDSAYSAYPTYHSIQEIRALLKSDYSRLRNKDDAAWAAVYQTILTQYRWSIPADLLKKLH